MCTTRTWFLFAFSAQLVQIGYSGIYWPINPFLPPPTPTIGSEFHNWKDFFSLYLWAEVWVQQCGVCEICPSVMLVTFSIGKPSESLLEFFLLKSILNPFRSPATQLIPSASGTNSPSSLKTSKASVNLFREKAKTDVFVEQSQQNQVRQREIIWRVSRVAPFLPVTVISVKTAGNHSVHR